jgi:uncharacterized protein YdhG (YjbR/CyaY superfamily)
MNKTPSVDDPVEDYIAAFPVDIQAILRQIRATIRAAAPDAQETIKYKMPAFVMDGFLVSFAAYKKHIGLYPAPSGDEAFNERLAPYRAERSSVRLPLNKPIPYDLIEEIVRLRVAEQDNQQ